MVAYYAARAMLAPGTPSTGAFFGLLALAMCVCGALGWTIERFAYRPLRSRPKITVLITAIGVSLLLENGGQLVFGPDPKFFPQLIESYELSPGSGIVVTNVQLLILFVSLSLMAALQYLVFRTRVGTALRAVSYSPEAASLMGIDVDRMISLTFVLGSMLAGAAGVLVGLSNPKIEPLMGIMPGLKAFVAAVIGGIGNIPGAMAGGILMGLSEVLVVGYVSSTYRDAIAFVILIVVLLVRPSGLFGASVEEKV
jgi:branched-chain amino acid transport system permease protein